MRITILGCGASEGVPIITGRWGECDPYNPKNRRSRASIVVEKGETTLLVDTSPDLRTQWLNTGLQKLDAVLYTHDHADHTHGINDLRPFTYQSKMPLPIYGDAETINSMKKRFYYAFPLEEVVPDIYRPFLSPNVIEGPFQLGNVSVTPFKQAHGYSTTLGYRFEKVAYSTDVVDLDEAAFKILEGIEVWIVDCISREPRISHSHLTKTLEWIARVRPRQAYLTHMSLQLDYDALMKELPKGVEPAYDGLVIEI
ncbi:MAG TPA: MBL fold metallo-hydrolase [Alphaproteobacteria bacterium]|nr:MBL fold metallo-hydrolase [Alphaproteobacteria bacterium]